MPLIEELPVSNATARPSHGWTYVTDNGGNVQHPSAPLKSRKRGRDGGAAVTTQAAHRLSAKQEKAIQQRLNDLGKENHRDVHIPIPKREGGRAGKERKTTQNVRRILAYSRTFQHYLADEEAGVNVYGSAGVVAANPATAAHPGQPSGGRADSKKKGAANESTPAAQKKQPPPPKRTGSLKQATSAQRPSTPVKKEKSDAGEDVKMSNAPSASPATEAQAANKTPTTPTQKSPQQKQSQQQQSSPITATNTTGTAPAPNSPAYDPALDHDPLLKTVDLPKMPSDRLMAALLAEPPLSYTAARAKPLDEAPSSGGGGSNILLAKPQRYFCAICGYWGKVRCKRACGERVCGLLECWKAHEGVCSLGAY
jgi:zinc finger HIT domain-containing protein 1